MVWSETKHINSSVNYIKSYLHGVEQNKKISSHDWWRQQRINNAHHYADAKHPAIPCKPRFDNNKLSPMSNRLRCHSDVYIVPD